MDDYSAPLPEVSDLFVAALALVLTFAFMAAGGVDLWAQTVLHISFSGLAIGLIYFHPSSVRLPRELKIGHVALVVFCFFLVLSTQHSGARNRSQEVFRIWLDAILLFWITAQISSRQKNYLLSLFYIPWTLLIVGGVGDIFLHRHPQATLLNSNFLAGSLILPFFLTLHRIRTSSTHIWLYTLWACLCGGVIVLTGSVGTWLAITFAAGYFVFPLKYSSTGIPRLVPLTAFLIFIVLLVWKLHNGWDQDRWNWWKICWSMTRSHPFLGNGPGSFELGSPHWNPVNLYSFYAHNTWLQYLSENGFFATGAFFVFVYECIKRQPHRLLVAAIIGVLFHNLIDSDLLIPAQLLSLAVWLALPLSSCQRTVAVETLPFQKTPLFPVFCLSALAFIAISAQRFRGDQLYVAALRGMPNTSAAVFDSDILTACQIAPNAAELYDLSAQKLLKNPSDHPQRSTLQLALAYERLAIAREPIRSSYVANSIHLYRLLGLPDSANQLAHDSMAIYTFLTLDKRIHNSLVN